MLNQIALTDELHASCVNSKTPAVFGAGIFFCHQLIKESVDNVTTSWTLFPVIPRVWDENKNDRRNMPPEFHEEAFTIASQRAKPFRINVIKSLVKEKR